MTLYTQEELEVATIDPDMRLLRAYAYDACEASFAQLVERHGKWVYGICRRALRDRELAEDATQAVFLTLARKALTLSDDTRLSGWLYRATCFAVADARKRERRYRRREEIARRLATERLEPATLPVDPPEASGALGKAMASLNERDRSVLLMHFFEGLTIRQMGEALGLSREGAKKRVSRALSRLRTRMARNPAAAALSGGLVATLYAVRAQAMPAELLRTIVTAAGTTGPLGVASLRGAGIAGAILRAIVRTTGVGTGVLRGAAVAKLAGTMMVVAACAIYTSPQIMKLSRSAMPAGWTSSAVRPRGVAVVTGAVRPSLGAGLLSAAPVISARNVAVDLPETGRHSVVGTPLLAMWDQARPAEAAGPASVRRSDSVQLASATAQQPATGRDWSLPQFSSGSRGSGGTSVAALPERTELTAQAQKGAAEAVASAVVANVVAGGACDSGAEAQLNGTAIDLSTPDTGVSSTLSGNSVVSALSPTAPADNGAGQVVDAPVNSPGPTAAMGPMPIHEHLYQSLLSAGATWAIAPDPSDAPLDSAAASSVVGAMPSMPNMPNSPIHGIGGGGPLVFSPTSGLGMPVGSASSSGSGNEPVGSQASGSAGGAGGVNEGEFGGMPAGGEGGTLGGPGLLGVGPSNPSGTDGTGGIGNGGTAGTMPTLLVIVDDPIGGGTPSGGGGLGSGGPGMGSPFGPSGGGLPGGGGFGGPGAGQNDVPEPSTLAMAIGMTAILAGRRRA